jgi:hypothetical protein
MIGDLTLKEKQAEKLKVIPQNRLSPLLEKNCLLLTGDESYQQAPKKSNH